ncbi:MAG: M20/M25/M40 family metallo-hydrolase, partial [Proteobacteria bacterium]|nr:M20/M25/M40 family metallo-hydrolase [Pseudomonadota bacterium]
MHRTRPLLIAAILFPLVLSVSTSVSGATPGPLPPEPDRILAREIFKQMIETNTTHAQGSTALATAIRDRLLAAGFPASDLALVTPTDHPAKGNLIVRLRGSGAAKPVLFLGHLDVVEARREDWSVDPFSFTEQEGWFYGRGTIDMKNGDAAIVESLIRLKREGFRPERDLIVALT